MAGPLEGIKVVELAEQGFVPSAAAALADWGADVVKIEKPGGDGLRQVIENGLMERAGDFNYPIEIANRNKRGICLDLSVAEGRALLDRLVRWADVFVTNQLPKVLRKYSIESDDLLAVNPRLVYARGHGQGQKGPEADAGGFDGVSYFARAAIAHMLTPPGADTIVGSRPAFGDHPSGTQLAAGIAAALVKVARTGEGVIVDVALLASGIWQLGPDLAFASVAGRAPRKHDITSGSASPLVGTYRTQDQRFLLLVMLQEERYWPRICDALERESLIGDPDYATPAKRRENGAALRSVFADVFASKSLAHWEKRLRAADCVFSRYASPEEVLEDPQVQINGYMPAHPTIEGARLPATPQQFDNEPVAIRRAAPAKGEHTNEVLREIGLSDADLVKLREASAIR